MDAAGAGIAQPRLTPAHVEAGLLARYDGLSVVDAWGERSLFHNPGGVLPRGIYFATIKQRDGANDRASGLDRDGVFRVNTGVSRRTYERLLGAVPTRPDKGGVVSTGHDFQQLDVLMPHPVYAWMGWVCVLNPSVRTWHALAPLFDEAHALAQVKFARRVR
ncbi:DUF6194 family protein [Lysobacter korlensis]|uniref:DUF6194 family protein n=1 Tax=Lysobacter korlensis TaxID=553636 RepID=A0ABV6RK77_9GAMM